LNNTKIQLHIAEEWTLEWCLYKSEGLSELFKQAVCKIHSKTKSFKKGAAGWNPNFEKTLIAKLTKTQSSLDKVAVANELAELIADKKPNLKEDDKYIQYLIKAIKHTCGIVNDN